MKKLNSEQLPQDVVIIENAWISMDDGVKIAARIFLPDTAVTEPVPALLEMMPYRKRDFSRHRDDEMQTYFAGNGYAVVRADVRGTGDSEGILADEYLPAEQDDAIKVLDWMRGQAWCSGSLGMMGLSWSGFSALQTAARRPKGLKAIVAVGSTDDRYHDDVHYKGGLMLVENPAWDATFLPMCALPPDPEISGDKWQEKWMQRLQSRKPWLPNWAQHNTRDDYWKQGSINEDYSAIECAVYTVSGYSDGYVDPVFRLAEQLTAPVKALVGPWPHVMPQEGGPGPAIGFLQETVRWWDYWLKGIDNGIMNEGKMRVFVKQWQTPAAYIDNYKGHWLEADDWPSTKIESRRFNLSDSGLDISTIGNEASSSVRNSGVGKKSKLKAKSVSSPLSVGLEAGIWGAGGGPDDLPVDQVNDDKGSLLFNSQPLSTSIDIVGASELDLEVSCDKPLGQIVVRLNDVSPDGVSLRLGWGVLNLTHRNSHEIPELVEPGSKMRVSLSLKSIGHSVPAGHRLRVAISSSYWPLIWPAPELFTLTIHSGTIDLPVWVGGYLEKSPFGDPEKVMAVDYHLVRPGAVGREVSVSKTHNQLITYNKDYGGMGIGAIGVETDIKKKENIEINLDNPLSARYFCSTQYEYKKEGLIVNISTNYQMRCDEDNFQNSVKLEVTLNGESFFSRQWDESVPREFG